MAAALCSGGETLQISGFELGAYDGCYSASSVSTFNFLPIFYIGGEPADGPTLYASDLFGSLTDDKYVWSIGNYDQDRDVVDARHCVDADGTDASTIHPSEVTTWTCEDSSAVTSTAFTVTCGCSTPVPTPAPTIAACAGRDAGSFRMSDFAEPNFDGCYSPSDSSTFNYNEIYFVGGEPADGPTVYASDLFGTLVDEFVWSIGNYRANSDDVNTRHCYDNSGTNASAIHPSEVTDWNCGGNPTAFSLTCGCATPAPVVNSPAPTPGLYLDPDGSRGIEIPEENMAEDESVPLPMIIVTTIVLSIIAAIALAVVFESVRKALVLCLFCKREPAYIASASSASASSHARDELPSAELGRASG